MHPCILVFQSRTLKFKQVTCLILDVNSCGYVEELTLDKLYCKSSWLEFKNLVTQMVAVSLFFIVIEGMILKSRVDKEPKRSLVIGIWSEQEW